MKKFIHYIFVFTLIYFCLITSVSFAKTDALCDKFLRVHVIANSDSPYDQAVKIMVRDFLFENHKDVFSSFKSKEDAINYLKENLYFLENEANDYLLSISYPYKAKISVEKEAFPKKNYGSITLPKGTYTAFKVTLGNGLGKNFFCVMFPPMCINSSVISDAPLKEITTDKEYKILKNKYKFKIADELVSGFYNNNPNFQIDKDLRYAAKLDLEESKEKALS